jgi:hypothetical protein
MILLMSHPPSHASGINPLDPSSLRAFYRCEGVTLFVEDELRLDAETVGALQGRLLKLAEDEEYTISLVGPETANFEEMFGGGQLVVFVVVSPMPPSVDRWTVASMERYLGQTLSDAEAIDASELTERMAWARTKFAIIAKGTGAQDLVDRLLDRGAHPVALERVRSAEDIPGALDRVLAQFRTIPSSDGSPLGLQSPRRPTDAQVSDLLKRLRGPGPSPTRSASPPSPSPSAMARTVKNLGFASPAPTESRIKVRANAPRVVPSTTEGDAVFVMRPYQYALFQPWTGERVGLVTDALTGATLPFEIPEAKPPPRDAFTDFQETRAAAGVGELCRHFAERRHCLMRGWFDNQFFMTNAYGYFEELVEANKVPPKTDFFCRDDHLVRYLGVVLMDLVARIVGAPLTTMGLGELRIARSGQGYGAGFDRSPFADVSLVMHLGPKATPHRVTLAQRTSGGGLDETNLTIYAGDAFLVAGTEVIHAAKAHDPSEEHVWLVLPYTFVRR